MRIKDTSCPLADRLDIETIWTVTGKASMSVVTGHEQSKLLELF